MLGDLRRRLETFAVKGMGDLPEPLQDVEDVQHNRWPREPIFFQVPK